ncbi:unnamed protein product [Gadus morhua 'NCC']
MKTAYSGCTLSEIYHVFTLANSSGDLPVNSEGISEPFLACGFWGQHRQLQRLQQAGGQDSSGVYVGRAQMEAGKRRRRKRRTGDNTHHLEASALNWALNGLYCVVLCFVRVAIASISPCLAAMAALKLTHLMLGGTHANHLSPGAPRGDAPVPTGTLDMAAHFAPDHPARP